MKRPLIENPVVRAGALAWAVVGLVVVLVLVGMVAGRLRLVVVPLLIALFPAALLVPETRWLERRGLPPAGAAFLTVLAFLLGLAGVLGVLGWLIAGELDNVFDTVEQGYADIREWSADAVGVDLPDLEEVSQSIRDWATSEDSGMGERAGAAAATTIELLSSIIFGMVALFFYLKDGARISTWLRDLFPGSVRDDVDEIGRRVWFTLGAYFRGQLVVAAVDAVFIGLGLLLLGVPLALPLAVLVFIGGLFPIIGAFTAGAVAVLIALADGGIVVAAAVLVLNVAVQQIEGNVLEPLVVGRATQLHPLAVIVALTAGAVTLGVLGAFLAVPIAASVARAVGYLRTDVEDPIADLVHDGDPD